MPARKDAAGELAVKLVQGLEALRSLGEADYPLSLRRLAERTDPGAPGDLALKAIKKKPFSDRAIAVQPKLLDSPVALVEDQDLLAGSLLLFNYLLELVCTPQSPTCDPAKLRTKVPKKLKPLFGTALERRIAEDRLPSGVSLVYVKKKRLLHLERFPLPQPADVALAAAMVQMLEAQRRLGDDRYPLEVARLIELTRPDAAPALLKKALRLPVFQQAVVLSLQKQPEKAVAALAGDRDQLVDSPRLLETILVKKRSAEQQVFTPADLKKAVDATLRTPFEEAVLRRVRDGTLPADIGSLWQKKGKPLLFLMRDVVAEKPAAPRPEAPAPAPSDFASAFEAAFQRLDRQSGGNNFVRLTELRRALPFERAVFDAELLHLRRAGRFTLSAAEGRFPLRPEDQEAAIAEAGALLLYVSRKQP